MPNIAAPFGGAPISGVMSTFNFPQNALGGGNLVGAHDQQGVANVKDRIVDQHMQQGVFLKKCGGKIF